MTATVTALKAPGRPCQGSGPDRLAVLRVALRPEFLTAAGWNPTDEVLAPPRTHPLLGLRKCAVIDCAAGARNLGTKLCQLCAIAHSTAGVSLEVFARQPSGRRNKGEMLCRVPGCERPSHLRALCFAHYNQRGKKHPDLSVEEFTALPGLKQFPAFGPCWVTACIRQAAGGSARLCAPHRVRWRVHQREQPTTSMEDWLRLADPINVDHFVILKGLPEQVRLELLVGIQARTDAGVKTPLTMVRMLVVNLRAQRVGSIDELEPDLIARHDVTGLLGWLCRGVKRNLSTPETERLNDVWDLAVFGLGGRLDFTVISQPWLRETTKRWVEQDLPLHRGRHAHATAKAVTAAVGELSESLRLARPGRGDQPEHLGRQDIIDLGNRLAFKERTAVISAGTRLARARQLRRFLLDIRAFGLTRPGGPAVGLPDDVVLTRTDIPAEPDGDEAGRALPQWVLAIINANLSVLEQRSGIDTRRLTELMIDTGRRPDELCRLPVSCLERDSSDKPVLIYTDLKNNRPDRRLPINEATAQIILDQQAQVRAQFPDTALKDLVLFPRPKANTEGRKPMSEDAFGGAHRAFINATAHLLTRRVIGDDGKPRAEVFDRATVFPYTYRHSYAQRHADQGVAPDVLRDLMGHRSIQTSLGYYRVTETRVREAVDRVSAHQFDGAGNRVFRGISGLLAHEHARMRIGQVAVPFGICTEPSNVKAGGQACPFKFTCLGCGHFRSDPSYLPELKSYLQQLLADRERLRAATELEEWAREKISPSDQEITRLRGLIRRIEADLDQLADDDQAQISEAVTVIRKTRQVVNLGMPAISTPGTEAG